MNVSRGGACLTVAATIIGDGRNVSQPAIVPPGENNRYLSDVDVTGGRDDMEANVFV
ncbi:MAG: hypothetical protein ACPGXK_01110 [Phycisphaerae bacterium]